VEGVEWNPPFGHDKKIVSEKRKKTFCHNYVKPATTGLSLDKTRNFFSPRKTFRDQVARGNPIK